MTAPGGTFSDLSARVASALVLALVGLGAIWAGGLWFLALVALSVAAMFWELVRMLDPGVAPGRRLALASGAGAAVLVADLLPPAAGLALVCLPALGGLALVTRHRAQFAVYGLLIGVAGFALHLLHAGQGMVWVLWLLAVVIASDVAGYFAGRLIGGPKLWPRVSPKKTWSGTVAGWALAAVAGLAFMVPTGAGLVLVPVSVVLAVAGQAGDIAESALKRMVGVKDSSNLLPGHGGVLDRFDALLGASIALLLLQRLAGIATGGAG